MLNTINDKKAFTQEVSKSIFYIHKNKNRSKEDLNILIKAFLQKMSTKTDLSDHIHTQKIDQLNQDITALWNTFYLHVQDFRHQPAKTTTYSGIIADKTVNHIYTTNLMLIVKFNALIIAHQKYVDNLLSTYKNIQYFLFLILIALLLYLFTKLKVIISFIQEFTSTSKKVIENSSIKDLQPMTLEVDDEKINQAKDNFNFLVDKINASIQYSHDSIEHTAHSLEQIEKNIEQFLELLSLNENNIDIELTKKEDAVIESLDELMTATAKLNDLKADLDNLLKK